VEERLRRRRADRLAEAEAAALEAKGLARSQAMLAKIKAKEKADAMDAALGFTPAANSPKEGSDLAGVLAASRKAKALARGHRLKHGAVGEAVAQAVMGKMEAAVNDADGHGWTPLHVACSTGNAELVAKLLEAGAMLPAKTHHGWRALHIAAAKGHGPVLRLLLSHPAVTSVEAGWVTDSEKNTCMHLAAGSKGPPLLGEGTPEALECVAEVLELLAAKLPSLVGSANWMGRTPLHLASEAGHVRTVRKLLELGGDLNAPDLEGWTPRQLAEFLKHTAVSEVFDNHLLLEMGRGVPKEFLPKPAYRTPAFANNAAQVVTARLRTATHDFRLETYAQNDTLLRQWVSDNALHEHLETQGPGQTPLDYDRHRSTFRGIPLADPYAKAKARARAEQNRHRAQDARNAAAAANGTSAARGDPSSAAAQTATWGATDATSAAESEMGGSELASSRFVVPPGREFPLLTDANKTASAPLSPWNPGGTTPEEAFREGRGSRAVSRRERTRAFKASQLAATGAVTVRYK